MKCIRWTAIDIIEVLNRFKGWRKIKDEKNEKKYDKRNLSRLLPALNRTISVMFLNIFRKLEFSGFSKLRK